MLVKFFYRVRLYFLNQLLATESLIHILISTTVRPAPINHSGTGAPKNGMYLRIFNPLTQAQKFDKNGDYIRQWVPELKSVETKALLSGDIDKSLRDRIGYVKPIVDHSIQQRKFKERYASQKAIGQIE